MNANAAAAVPNGITLIHRPNTPSTATKPMRMKPAHLNAKIASSIAAPSSGTTRSGNCTYGYSLRTEFRVTVRSVLGHIDRYGNEFGKLRIALECVGSPADHAHVAFYVPLT